MLKQSKYNFGQKYVIQKKLEIPGWYDWSKLQYVPAHKIAYYELANNDIELKKQQQTKVIICLHGLSRNGRDFDRLLYKFDNNYKIYSIDIVGRGDSDWLVNKLHYNFSTYTNDIIYFIKTLFGTKSVTIIGTSMGGLIAMLIAYKYPKFIEKIILNDIGPYIPAAGLTNIANYVSKTVTLQNIDAAKLYFKKIFSTFGIQDEEDWEHTTKHSIYKNQNNVFELKYDPNIILSLKGNFTNFLDINLWYIWYKISCPVMIIRGENSTILLEQTANEMVSSKNNVKLFTFKNIGHAPALMDDSQLDMIYNWLNNIN